jgi:hypothetical protein
MSDELLKLVKKQSEQIAALKSELDDLKELTEMRSRPVMLVCGKCKHHDVQYRSLLEIDAHRGKMSWICRECSHTNEILLNAKPASLPKINVRR